MPKSYMACYMIIVTNVILFFLVHFSQQPVEFLRSLIATSENLEAGRWWCILSAGFIHVDLVHLFLNMLGVFVFGRIVEEHLGFGPTLFIYFGALIISMFFAIILNAFLYDKHTGIIGASGAVMGLLATAMLLDPFRITYEMIFPIPVMFKGWMYFYADFAGLVNPRPDGISHTAHIMGFLSIFCLVYFVSKDKRKKMTEGLMVNIFSLIFFFGSMFVIYMLKTQSAS